MPIPPPGPTLNSIVVTALDIVKDALKEIGALAPGEMPSNEDSADVLRKLQRVIDRFNAREATIFNVDFTVFDLLGSAHSPYTIGPGGDFQANQRPVKIYSCSLILVNSTPTQVEIPVQVRDDDWWANNRVKNLQSTLPTDLYYTPSWPSPPSAALGQCFFWPIPTAVNQVRLETRNVLSQLTSYSQNFSMPPGYWDGVVYSLAESLGPMYERPISADLLRLKAEAMKAVMTNNIKSPPGTTGDVGMPGIGTHGDFNYVSSLPSNS